jgi:hypothetical protein
MDGPRSVVASGTIEVIETSRPFSNIAFNALRFDALPPLARILSQCRSLEYKILVIEEIPSVGSLKSDDEELLAADCGFIKSSNWRLSFFNESFSSADSLASISPESFLGYVIVKQNHFAGERKNLIFESVLCRPRFRNNYLHTSREYKVLIAGHLFSVVGNIYCQQNGVTSSCAHVALRTALSALLPDGDITYQEINAILQTAGQPHVLRQGLIDLQIMEVIRAKGFRSYFGRFTKGEKGFLPFRKFLYGSVESGFPALLGFHFEETNAHILPVLGHTFNEDTWIPRASASYFRLGQDTRYVPSESWVSTYVIHDDNWGSNYCLPRGYLSEDNVGIAIGILPPNCNCDPIEAEAIAIDYLYSIVPHIPGGPYWNMVLRNLVNGWVVLRPVLLSGKQYVAHIKSMKGWKGEQMSANIVDALEGLDGLYWVVEISYPELFPANRRKLGEILIKASVKPSAARDFRSFLLARLPSALYILGDVQDGSQASFKIFLTGISDHVPIIDLSALPPGG